MPQYTVIRDDNIVCVDKDCRTVDCSGLPVNVHAVQYNTVEGKGVVELNAPDGGGTAREKVLDGPAKLAPYKYLLDAWAASGGVTPTPQPPPASKEEQADNQYANVAALRGLVAYIANKEGRADSVVWAEIKALIP